MSLKHKPKSNRGTTVNVQSWVDIRYLAVIAKHKNKRGVVTSELVREIIEEVAMECMRLGTKPILSLDEAHAILFPEEDLYSNMKTPKEEALEETLRETFSSIDLSTIKRENIINLPSEKELQEEYKAEQKKRKQEEKTIGILSQEEKDKRNRILEINQEIEQLTMQKLTAKDNRRLESLRSEQLELAKDLGLLG